MSETVWETTRHEKKVNVTDALFAIADGLENISNSIDAHATETRSDRVGDVADAVEEIAKAIENGLSRIADTI